MKRHDYFGAVLKKNVLLFMSLLVLTNLSTPRHASASVAHIPKTGQTLCYGTSDGKTIPCSGTGQDAAENAGFPLPPVRFSTGVAGMVTDSLTGLSWVADGTLMVSRDPAIDLDGVAGDGKVTWFRALEYISKINNERYLGYADWRLPNIKELASLLDAGKIDMADWLASAGLARIERGGYWSSTSSIRNATYAWLFNMKTKQITYAVKSDQYSLLAVRSDQSNSGLINLPQTGQQNCYDPSGNVKSCVGTNQDADSRSGVALPANRFTHNQDTTLTDTLTGLAWAPSGNAPGPTACTPSVSKSWRDALEYVACLNVSRYLNHSDWRLPNIQEMQSLLDYGRSDMAAYLNTAGFTDFTISHYWTSTSVDYATPTAWLVHLSAATFPGGKASLNRVIPVRGGFTGPPSIEVTPSKVNLGTVALGKTTATTEINIVNTSSAGSELTINAISLDGTAAQMFTLTSTGSTPCIGLPLLLPPSSSCSIGVSFAPSSAGLKKATVRIVSDDLLQPVADVSLEGEGVFQISTTGIGKGTVTCSAETIPLGGALTCSVLPGVGYELQSLTDNGTDVTAAITSGVYALTGISTGHNLIATFTIKHFTVSGVIAGNLGTISCEPVIVAYGESPNCDVLLNPGHILMTLYDNGVDLTANIHGNSYTLPPVTQDHSIVVETAVYPLRTGQTACSDSLGNGLTCFASGQDGAFLAGVPLPSPRYNTMADGTVEDPLTGLVWAPSGSTPGPAVCNPGTQKSWQEALAYVACLNDHAYLGFADWRLPNIRELLSLFDFGQSGVTTFLNSTGFSGFKDDFYWTSTTVPYGTHAAWMVHFAAGTFVDVKTTAHLVIPVRKGASKPGRALGRLAQSGQQSCYATNGALVNCTGSGQDGESRSGVAWPTQRFTLQPDGTVRDRLTGLNWAPDGDVLTSRDALFDRDGTVADGKVTWQHALDYIRKLNTGAYLGYQDWRLPNINELSSLTNASNGDLTAYLNRAGFAKVTGDGYWTSTSVQSNPAYAWRALFQSQQLIYATKNTMNRIFPVRRGYSGDAMTVFTPASHDFGLIDLTVASRHDVTISNSPIATQPLVIRSVLIAGPQADSFKLSTGGSHPCPLGTSPFSLLPGGSCTVAIDFVPQVAGVNLATLSVTAGNTSVSQADVPLSGTIIDTYPPTALILSPQTGAVVHGDSVTISGTAKDLSGVARVDVSTDGGVTWSSASGKENWSFNWSPTHNGDYTLKVRVIDMTGLVQTDVPEVIMTVDNTPPVAVFIAPVNGATVSSGTVYITGTATDIGAGVQFVEISTDGGVTWSTAVGMSPWAYTWKVPQSGSYTFLARAIDRAGNVQSTAATTTINVDILTYVLPNSRLYPVVWSGQTITASALLTSIETFTPTFGQERKIVNPALPAVNGVNLTFTVPGEYYLKLNGTQFLKILVLSPQEPLSAHVMRIFNFCVANMFQSSEDEVYFNSNKAAYVNWWFQNPDPARILCGPTAQFFNMIIKDVLALPTRKVTFPGVFRYEGLIYKSSHNVLEVYLPDLGKWTLFDINYGFASLWMDAFDLVDFARANSSGSNATGFWAITDALKNLDISKDTPVPYYAKHNDIYTGHPFSPAELSSIPMTYLWKEAFRFYYSGLAYWGKDTNLGKPTGTEFLSGQYIFANRHTDPALEQEAVAWIESFGLEVTRVSQKILMDMLAAGFNAEISAKAWLQRLPR